MAARRAEEASRARDPLCNPRSKRTTLMQLGMKRYFAAFSPGTAVKTDDTFSRLREGLTLSQQAESRIVVERALSGDLPLRFLWDSATWLKNLDSQRSSFFAAINGWTLYRAVASVLVQNRMGPRLPQVAVPTSDAPLRPGLINRVRWKRLAAIRYWEDPQILEGGFTDPTDHEWMSRAVHETIFRARDQVLAWILGNGTIDSLFWTEMYRVHHAVFQARSRRRSERGGVGPAPHYNLESALSGMLSGPTGSLVQILNAWIDAVLVDLPARLSSDPRRRKIYDRLVANRDDFLRWTLANADVLGDAPASLSNAVFQAQSKPIPRDSRALLPGKLRAELTVDNRIVAVWDGVDLSGERMAASSSRCLGRTRLAGSLVEEEWVRATEALVRRICPELPSDQPGLTPIEMSLFLLLFSAPDLLAKKLIAARPAMVKAGNNRFHLRDSFQEL